MMVYHIELVTVFDGYKCVQTLPIFSSLISHQIHWHYADMHFPHVKRIRHFFCGMNVLSLRLTMFHEILSAASVRPGNRLRSRLVCS